MDAMTLRAAIVSTAAVPAAGSQMADGATIVT
jgi:hypothetical protein